MKATFVFLVIGLKLLCLSCVSKSSEAYDSSVKSSKQLSSSNNTATAHLQQEFVSNYAQIVYSSYSDVLKETQKLQQNIKDFLDHPNESTLNLAKKQWIVAHKTYGITEVYRFYGGPIDELEPKINPWPIDEAYIDYVNGDAKSGIVQHPELYPNLSSELVAELHQKDGERNVSTGFHAIEFLLWGQDLSKQHAGKRTFKDYVINKKSNARSTVQRRRKYLETITSVLKDQIESLTKAWDSSIKNSYANQFTQMDPKEGVAKILLGMTRLAVDEMIERTVVPLASHDQEQEQSCFSDTTHLDLQANAQSLENVYLGNYKNIHGTGLYAIATAQDPELAEKLKQLIHNTVQGFKDVPAPFDNIITSPKDSPGRIAVEKAVASLYEQTRLITKLAFDMGILIETQETE